MRSSRYIKFYLFITIVFIIIVIFILFVNPNVLKDEDIIKLDESNIKIYTSNLKIKDIVMGDYHTIVEDTNGELWVCGSNSYGQLGIGNEDSQEYFVKMGKTDTGKNIVSPNKIIAGHNITIIEDKDGEIWVCGDNSYGQLGIGNKETTSVNKLTKLGKTETGKEIINPNIIECGYNFTVIEDADGIIWICGDYSLTTEESLIELDNGKISNPRKIAVGGDFIIIEDSDGTVWGCGDNTYGQLFDYPYKSGPILNKLKTIDPFPNKIVAGFQHVLIEKSDGTVIGAGRNSYGELTNAATEKKNLVDLQYQNGEKVISPKSIVCNSYVTIIEDNIGQFWVCGWNYGQFGNSTENYYENGYSNDDNVTIKELTLLKDLSKKSFNKINKIYVGNRCLVIEDENNYFWCSGNNESGQLGLGTMLEERTIGKFVEFAKDRKHLYINNVDKENEYEIVNSIPGFDAHEEKRGYKIVEKNGFYYIVISMGEHNTGGYSIDVAKVNIDGNNIHIYVKEKTPGLYATVTMAFTCPYTIVKLNFKPDFIIVENQETNKNFKKLKK